MWALCCLPRPPFGVVTFTALMIIGVVFREPMQIGRRFREQRTQMFLILFGALVLLVEATAFLVLGTL
jgi:hypothetical protein